VKAGGKMEAICSPETSVDTQRTTRRYIPEDGTLAQKSSVPVKKDFLASCDRSLKYEYVEKWFDFSDNYSIQFLSLKKEPTHSDFKALVVV
jgi:hypothetical protein